MWLRVQRFEPGRDASPRYQTYELEDTPGQTVLGALFEVQNRQDGSIAFRYSCRGAVCGICAMLINKVPRLACKTQVSDAMEGVTPNIQTFGPIDHEVEDWDPETEILIEPLPNFPVVRDLVVDLGRFWEALEEVEPWLVPAEDPPRGLERSMDHGDVLKLERLVGCILCALCSGSCPIVHDEQDFLGPAALAKARRFYEDPRDVRRDGILEMLYTEEGFEGCDLIYNCVKVCPRNVAPGGAIRKLKKDASRLPSLERGRS